MQPHLKDFEFCNAYPELDTVNIMGGLYDKISHGTCI